MNKYQAKKTQQGDYALFINEMQSICPFVPAIPMQGNMGQVQLHRLPCTDLCPHASISSNHWNVTCSGSLVKHTLSEDEPQEEKPKSNLIIV
jgi:hypothetical protein